MFYSRIQFPRTVTKGTTDRVTVMSILGHLFLLGDLCQIRTEVILVHPSLDFFIYISKPRNSEAQD